MFRSKEHEWNEYSTFKTCSILITIKCQQISTRKKHQQVSEKINELSDF